MALMLFFLMLLVWLALGAYQDDAPVGCLMLVCVPMIAFLLFAMQFLVWASTLGRKSIYVTVEDV